jgi:hypothetical protein
LETEKEDIIEKSESSDITTIKNSFVDEGLHSTTSPKQCEKWARNESLETMKLYVNGLLR